MKFTRNRHIGQALVILQLVFVPVVTTGCGGGKGGATQEKVQNAGEALASVEPGADGSIEGVVTAEGAATGEEGAADGTAAGDDGTSNGSVGNPLQGGVSVDDPAGGVRVDGPGTGAATHAGGDSRSVRENLLAVAPGTGAETGAGTGTGRSGFLKGHVEEDVFLPDPTPDPTNPLAPLDPLKKAKEVEDFVDKTREMWGVAQNFLQKAPAQFQERFNKAYDKVSKTLEETYKRLPTGVRNMGDRVKNVLGPLNRVVALAELVGNSNKVLNARNAQEATAGIQGTLDGLDPASQSVIKRDVERIYANLNAISYIDPVTKAPRRPATMQELLQNLDKVPLPTPNLPGR